MRKEIILSYFYKHRVFIAMYAFLSAAVGFILFMYSLPVQTIVSVFLLISACLLSFAAIDYYRYYYKQKLLWQMRKEVVVTLERLPEAQDKIEDNYQELLKVLYGEKNRAALATDNQFSQMLDYYSLWAHQIKTPIAALRLLLQMDEFPDKKVLNQELFKIEQYVEMVMQYLRIEDISSDLILETNDVATIVKQASKKYASIFIAKKIALELGNLEQSILTDAKWLGFVIEQLLSNALKYTNSGGKIAIYIEENYLIIEDNGIGISQEDLPRIFEKGFTGYNGRMDKKSTGIGLFLVHKILGKLGLSISFTSDVGVGTKAKINLYVEDLSAG